MPFESFAHVPISDAVLAHIWEGEPGELNQGGHRYGLGRSGKTEFPEHWDFEMVAQAVRLVLDRPQSVRMQRQKVICMRVVKQVIIEVHIKRSSDGLNVVGAFPRCGDGVIQNVFGRQISLPLDIRMLEV